MKLLGHVLVATKSFPEKDKLLLALGALLPETALYIKNPALTYEQIHEGGLDLYNFCHKNYPDFVDLGIGSMTHSYKYGADSYNSIETFYSLGFVEENVPKISDTLGLDLKTARARMHNLYDLSLDFYINQKYPDIKTLVEKTKNLDYQLISKILSECYQTSQADIYNNLIHLWEKYDPKLTESFEGLAQLWKILASDLKEKDPVNIKKTSTLLKFFYEKLKPDVDEFISDVIEFTRSNVSSAIKY